MRSILNKKMPPALRPMALTAQRLRGLRSGSSTKMIKARSCGLLDLIRCAVSRSAEHIRAQLVPGYRAVGGLFDFYAVFSGNYAK